MNEKAFEKISRYINGEMDPVELKEFEYSLTSDEDLASAYTIYRALENKMPLYEENNEREEALKKSNQHLNAKYFNNNLAGNIPATGYSGLAAKTKLPALQAIYKQVFSKWALVAASIAGIIILSVSLYIIQQKKGSPSYADKTSPSPLPHEAPAPPSTGPEKQAASNAMAGTKGKAIYTLNFKPDEVPSTTEGPLQDAFESYENGDYKQAAASFENLAPAEVTRGEQEDTLVQSFYAAYYKGLCYMATGRFLKARSSLQNAVELSPGRTFKVKAQWYLALVYLNTGSIPDSKTLLKQVALSITTPYKVKAVNLLNELDGK